MVRVNELGLNADRLAVIDMHTAGEPVRIFDATPLNLPGKTILEKRRAMGDRFDHLRRAMMLEPRGHADMYGAILVSASDPACDAAVLFTHNSGYSTMCGHATIALGRFLSDQARLQGRNQTRFTLECPCGPVAVEVFPDSDPAAAPMVRFESVESFALALDDSIELEGVGRVQFDIGYGGAFYAILALAAIMLLSARFHIPETITGLIGAHGDVVGSAGAGGQSEGGRSGLLEVPLVGQGGAIGDDADGLLFARARRDALGLRDDL